jgi:predicted MFS family arabinose efflux permease
MNSRHFATAVLSASIAVMISTGIRSSFGLFLQPVSESLGTGREVYSLAIALQNLIYGLPFVGILSDRTSSRRVMVGGGLLYALGLVLISLIARPTGLIFSLGILVGLALSATTYVVVLGAVGQIVSPVQRTTIFGFVTAVGASGMFVIPPLTQLFISNFGWETALICLAFVASIIILLAFGLPKRSGGSAGETTSIDEEPTAKLLTRARRNRGYLLLTTGFFVCGFHVAFIGTHLPAYLTDNGFGPFVGAAALSLIGVFNMVGSFSFGWLGDRFRKKYLLSFIYAGRALTIALFLIVPLSQPSAFLFSATMGFLWLATVPLTSGTVAQIFGARYLSTLYGIVFFSHQLGAFLGVWLGGRLYDTLGTYNPVWYIAILLGIAAAIIHTPISDQPDRQLQTAYEASQTS